MRFVSHGRFLGVVGFIYWCSVSMTTAAITSQTTATAYQANTTAQNIWPDYARYSKAFSGGSGTYTTTIPFTYYECITNLIHIVFHGYLALGSRYYRKDPPAPAEWPSLPKLLGIYWSSLNSNYDQTSQYIYFSEQRLENVTYKNSLYQYIKDVISEPEFEPLVFIAATWENIKPDSYKHDTATFQVLLATDSQVTYAIRGYQSVWQSPQLANATYYAATYSLGYGERPKISIPGSHAGPEVIRLGTKKPNKDPYSCVEKTQIVLAHLDSSLYDLPPCPCYEVQAAEDQQFTTSNVSTRCYQSKTPPAGGSLLQLCCYNLYGHLINYTREARVPVSADPTDLRLQEAYEKCCADGSGLCEWFYYRIYTTKCVNYTPAFNRTELPEFYIYDDVIVLEVSGFIEIRHIHVKSRTRVTYSISTTFKGYFGFDLYHNNCYVFTDGNNNPFYTWRLSPAIDTLWEMSYPQRLLFYATNANNMSAPYAPIFKLCLCNKNEQCNVNSYSISQSSGRFGMDTFFGLDSYERGNVNSMMCDCKGKFTGRFCEKSINACDNCLVNKTSGCDSNPQDYCPVCPFGYQRSGTQCLENGSSKIDGADLLVILCSISSYTLWMQKLLLTRM